MRTGSTTHTSFRGGGRGTTRRSHESLKTHPRAKLDLEPSSRTEFLETRGCHESNFFLSGPTGLFLRYSREQIPRHSWLPRVEFLSPGAHGTFSKVLQGEESLDSWRARVRTESRFPSSGALGLYSRGSGSKNYLNPWPRRRVVQPSLFSRLVSRGTAKPLDVLQSFYHH